MANSWLRLWHDMPNDPKWRTIARASEQPIALVQAVYIHLLVDASRNVTRGHVTVTTEDLASALDVTEDAIKAVLTAMQGRVLEGDMLSGWNSRQPKREDVGDPENGVKSATQRKREQRKRERESKKSDQNDQRHDESRNVTLDKDKEEDTDIKKKEANASSASTEKISLDAFGKWTKVSPALLSTWSTAYPALSLDAELSKAAAWILANPKNKKSNYARFLTNWLSRAQDSARPVVQNTSNRADKRAEWMAEVSRSTPKQTPMKDMGVIDATC